MLIFPLKKEWYEKIRSGKKTIEYREVKPYWTKRLQRAEYAQTDYHWDFKNKIYVFQNYSAPCILQLGYTKERMEAWITKIEVVDGLKSDLHIDRLVYAIYLSNIKEI